MASKSNRVLYFAPHQDDELLTMGLDICESVKKRMDVHVILCADGSKSGVRNVLKNGKTCNKHEGTHCYDLTTEEFIRARDREFRGSCLAMGVKPENIHIPEKRAVDGSVSVKQAEDIMMQYLQLLGKDSLVCTISSGNGDKQHRDHKAVGKAAENLVNRNVIPRCKVFVEPYHYHQICDNARGIPVDPYVLKASPATAEKLKKAIASYSLWDPEQKRYAVGYHSVTVEFNDFLKEMKGWWFWKQNASSMSRKDRLIAQHRKWRKLYKQKQLYYSMKSCPQPDLGALHLIHIPVGKTEDYRVFCETHAVDLRDKDLQRLCDGASFWCLAQEDGTVVTSGWMAWKQHFYIGETDFGFHTEKSGSAILFDFNTKPEYRGNGYYGLLLRAIAANAEDVQTFVIYTSPHNHASDRGIRKAGFRFDGAMTAKGGSLRRYLRGHGFSRIYRKNQFWGLRVRS